MIFVLFILIFSVHSSLSDVTADIKEEIAHTDKECHTGTNVLGTFTNTNFHGCFTACNNLFSSTCNAYVFDFGTDTCHVLSSCVVISETNQNKRSVIMKPSLTSLGIDVMCAASSGLIDTTTVADVRECATLCEGDSSCNVYYMSSSTSCVRHTSCVAISSTFSSYLVTYDESAVSGYTFLTLAPTQAPTPPTNQPSVSPTVTPTGAPTFASDPPLDWRCAPQNYRCDVSKATVTNTNVDFDGCQTLAENQGGAAAFTYEYNYAGSTCYIFDNCELVQDSSSIQRTYANTINLNFAPMVRFGSTCDLSNNLIDTVNSDSHLGCQFICTTSNNGCTTSVYSIILNRCYLFSQCEPLVSTKDIIYTLNSRYITGYDQSSVDWTYCNSVTLSPTTSPSQSPSQSPSKTPTTKGPTSSPSATPSKAPSASPTKSPTFPPTDAPSTSPTTPAPTLPSVFEYEVFSSLAIVGWALLVLGITFFIGYWVGQWFYGGDDGNYDNDNKKSAPKKRKRRKIK